ncbi:MAG: aminoglycoside phosphotransferase family protein [Bacteroidales bacterium]|nr:aminoglycoside phosphotransferase family protein [Bacteroidales bacterium]
MTILTSIEEKIGKIESSQIKLIEAYCNRVFLYEITTSNGRFFKFIEKAFVFDQDYPQKGLVESQTSQLLSNEGFLVPKIVYEDDSRIVYEYIESKSIDTKDLQKSIVKLVSLIHSRTQSSESPINKSIPWRNAEIRIRQIYNWIDLLSQAGLKIHINKDKIVSALKARDSKQNRYVLTLSDCGTHNAIYDGNNVYLIDFERACYGYPADDIASLIIEEINPVEDILRMYFESSTTQTKIHRNADFNFELSSSLFERSLEILVYFGMGKGNISETNRKSILIKYSRLVDKYHAELINRIKI